MPEEGEVARFVLDAQGGHVACATECEIRLAFVKGSPEGCERQSINAPWDPAEIRITLYHPLASIDLFPLI